jgi:pantetheine-phosphate adenylyltransferase
MKIGIYPGTFDPVTHGHTDIITRSLRVFDKVIVAVAPNPTKHPLFNLAERLDMVRLVMKDLGHAGQVEVVRFEGLLVDYVQRSGSHAIIRGLRAISDFEHEFQMALINRKLAKEVETVFLMSSEEYSYLSSTIMKDIANHGGSLEAFLHPEVARRLQERIRSIKP